MAFPSVTYTFARSNASDPTQLNRNFQDIIDGLTDGTKTLNVAGITGSSLSISGLVASQAVFTNAATQLVSKAVTGTGSVALSNGPTFDGDVNITRSSVGGIVGLLLQNTAASGTSPAIMTIDGASGSGHIYFKTAFASLGQGWVVGAGAPSAALIITPASTSAIPSSPMILITRAGNVISTVNWDVSQSSAGGEKYYKITNESSSASSRATMSVTVTGGTAGDPIFQWAVASVTTTWTAGIDNSVSGDPWVLAASAALGTSNALSITTAGNVTVSGDMNIASGKVYKVNSVQILTSQQTGLGASLGSATAGATYTAAEQTMLQDAHDKIRLLEAAMKVHGLVAT